MADLQNKKRVYAYFDGSNFYHNAKNNYGITSVNFLALSNNLIDLKQEEIKQIFYFNTPLNSQDDPGKYAQQQRFFAKVRATPFTKFIPGNFVRRPLGKIHINCKQCGHQHSDTLKCPKCSCEIPVSSCSKITEKGVDVHLAIKMILDGIDDNYDIVLLFSGDADFSPAIQYIVNKLNKQVIYCCFPRPKTSQLRQVCSSMRIITKDHMIASQA